MPSRLACAVAFTLLTIAAPSARAYDDLDPDEVDEDDDYTNAGTVEVGGSVGLSWTKNDFSFDAGPSLGWFIRDRLELSVLLRFEYENQAQSDGPRTSTESGSLILEPSYHHPLQDKLFVFGGLGVGVGYDGNHPDFELIPRVGLNIESGTGAVFTPAIRVPLLFGENQGINNEEFGLLPGVAFEFGVTTNL